ncbi:MAG: hypothetical protein ACRDKG_11015, partial [Actinomycetota bacterium]
LWNQVDRTALARYLVWDVTVKGDQAAVDAFIAARGGTHIPRSGSVEAHNESVDWQPKMAQVGAYEDRVTGQAILTSIAAGAGLAKTWLAEPEDANRATSITMAEPVRRRVGGVQELWLAINTELVRFAVDRAVDAGQLDREVEVKTGKGVQTMLASDTVIVTGPEIAASDAKVATEILTNLSTALIGMIDGGVLSQAAAKLAAKKAWEDFTGVPYTSELDDPDDVDEGDLEEILDESIANRRSAIGLIVG